MKQKVIAFFPEAAYGPALNSVGIAQACEALGHKAVFLTDPGMSGVYAGYGFEEHMVNMSAPMPAEKASSPYSSWYSYSSSSLSVWYFSSGVRPGSITT